MTTDIKKYGRHLRDTVDHVRSGDIESMSIMDELTPTDLRRGADRAEADARFRRALADQLESEGRVSITVGEAASMRAQDA